MNARSTLNSSAVSDMPSLSDRAAYVDALRRDVAGFERLTVHLKRLTGIHLPTNDKNKSLMAARLSKVLKEHELPNYGAFAVLLSQGCTDLAAEFIEALTTNTTQFFREATHFELLSKLLPGMIKEHLAKGKVEFRMWCAAASTGQEPYTMLMTLLEAVPALLPGAIKFLASDIDRTVLARAASGTYSQAEIEGVPAPLRQKYFTQRVVGNNGRAHQLNLAQRRIITFAPLNLTVKPYPFQHSFDVIFCRNVLIYFEKNMAVEVTARLMKALAPGGYLFLGHSESGLIKGDGFKSIASAVYRKDP